MSVAQELGMIDHDGHDDVASHPHTLRGWMTEHSDRLPTDHLPTLRRWLQQTDPQLVDDLLLSLARSAATDGGNDVMAAKLLAWALLPGARQLARQLRSLSPVIDHLVAAQLWIEIRQYPWQRRRRVAANILRQTRVGVLTECEVPNRLQRSDPTWYMLTPNPPRLSGIPVDEGPATAAEELQLLLEWAVEEHVITPDDRVLLLRLVEAAGHETGTHRTCSMAGLLAHSISGTVADELGVSARTIRRRATRCFRALADAAPSYTLHAS